MTGKILILFQFCFVIYYNSEQSFASNEVKKNLCDVLTALLGHPQWTRITDVKAKSQYLISFSGQDLFIYRGLLSHTKNIENSYVTVDNVYKKFYMVNNLLGCVYANAIDTFTTLIKNLLSVSLKERQKSLKRAYMIRSRLEKKKICLENIAREQIQSKRLKTEVQHNQHHNENNGNSDEDKDNEQNIVNVEANYCPTPLDQLADFTDSWKMFNYTYQQLLGSQEMFKYMYDALVYLFRFISHEKNYLRSNMFLKQIILLVGLYKDISINLKTLLPTYIGEDDVDYNSKVGTFSKDLLNFIDSHNTELLSPFVDNRCILPIKDNQPIKKILQKFPNEFKKKEKSDIIYDFEHQIQDLVNIVINYYYLDLGFVYIDKFVYDIPSWIS